MTTQGKKPGLFVVMPKQTQFELQFGRTELESRKELGKLLGVNLDPGYPPEIERMISQAVRHYERKRKLKAS